VLLLAIRVFVFTVFCIVSFMCKFPYLFCLYCHLVTTQLVLVILLLLVVLVVVVVVVIIIIIPALTTKLTTQHFTPYKHPVGQLWSKTKLHCYLACDILDVSTEVVCSWASEHRRFGRKGSIEK
jgi:hypothetical protein